MGIELQPGEPCYEARLRDCTCTWLRGFTSNAGRIDLSTGTLIDVGGDLRVTWLEEIIWYDPECTINHPLRKAVRNNEKE